MSTSNLLLIAIFAAYLLSAQTRFSSGNQQPGNGETTFSRAEMLTKFILVDKNRKELGLTEEQVSLVQKINDGFGNENAKMSQLVSSFRRAKSEERAAYSDEMRKIQDDLERRFYERLSEIFSEEQMIRFKQLRLRSAGPRAILNQENLEKLQITDGQKKQLSEILETDLTTMSRMSREERDKYRLNANEKVMSVLSDKQRAQWLEMLGPEP
jgi:hypothetical protein